MILKSEIIRQLKEYFDLNIYETKVWLALLSKGIASAGEVAQISSVPRSRTYDVLESLEKRGFAIVKIGKPVKYIAVKPTEVIEKLKSNTMHDAQEKVTSLTNLKDTQEYAELEQLHNSGMSPIKYSDLTGSIKGRANIISRMREVLENAQKEVVICTSASDFEDKSRVLAPTIEKLSKKNVKIKLALSGDEEQIKKISGKLSIKAKTTDSTARMCISDRKEVLFMVTPENSKEDVAVWLNSPFFVVSLYNLFDQNQKRN